MHCMLMDLLHGFEVLSTTEETLFNNRHLIGSYLISANQASSFNACNVETSFTASNW